ncbi:MULTISPECIES: hypothetical protein [Bacillus]|nr:MULTISPECIES: hypothetical protein [Bacillus]EJQ08776.1 hypothetical protein IC5_00755 [Bacillus cereus AND1407]KFL83084.1 glyoxalase/bleomycin resistance /dioxygenase domain protein [Bacillus cereus]MRA61213.1 hypothetical protein [Bacillus thuringiensis]CKF78455.1 Uncharacterised protein [Streptococcus pneumoniae]MBE5112391.1 hypothetical protein [Bacillus paranthracis]
MIKGLYEEHLPVRNLEVSISFYESLGLKLYKRGTGNSSPYILIRQL